MKSTESILNQARKLVKDGVDYLESVIELLQVRVAELTLSGLTFFLLLLMAGVLGLTAFGLFNVALGFWLQSLTHNVGWTILILGTVYAVVSFFIGRAAFRWLNQLRS